MTPETILFYLFGALLLFAGVRVVTARNPVHAALYLVLAFFTAAALWLLLRAEFLALTLIVVYVGAVMVLFLFVVMMLDVNMERLREGFWRNLPLALVVGGLMVFEMIGVLWGRYYGTAREPTSTVSNTRQLGRVLYTDYVYAFEIAAVVLLVAIVAAIALTLRRRKDARSQDVNKQVAVKKKDRLRIISMPAESKKSGE